METNLVDTVTKILHVTSYIAMGGLLSAIFFFAFAPSLLGIIKMQRQLEMIEKESRDTNRLLAQINEQLQLLYTRKGDISDQEPKT